MAPPLDDDDPLIGIAGAISDGTPVNWDDAQTRVDTPADAALLEQLRLIDRIAAVHGERTSWGSLSLLEPLGYGSFGTVYRATDPDLQRQVALKVVQPDGQAAAFDPERLVREARRLARVRHPNIVTVFAAERHGDEVGVSMELINGHTLHDLVQRSGPYSAREAAVIGMDVCRALAAVHAAGLLHGDVKAQNVMREEGGRVVLMDFGAGRDLHSVPQAANDFAGTPLYIAPEVFAGHPRSRASDVYSVGVLLYYLATGSYPVEGDTRSQIDQRHQDPANRRRLRDVRPDLPDTFIRVVERAIADNPADRYRSAGELEAALARTLTGRSDAAEPPGRRRAAPIAVLAVLALAATAYWAVSDRMSSYRVEAAVYRVGPDGPVRLGPGARVAPGDELFLQIETSVPAHVYVVNEDERGESYLLFPLPGQRADPLPGERVHRIPGVQNGQEKHWQVSSAGGREHLLIFVSPEPLAAFAPLFSRLRAPTDGPAPAVRISNETIGELRGIGDLVPAAAADPSHVQLSGQFTVPLGMTAETASGLWVRQISFENPGQ